MSTPKKGKAAVPPLPDPQQTLAFLHAIEKGEAPLQTDREPQSNVVVHYAVHRGPWAGWQLDVFNDCGEWDYLELVQDPSGAKVEYSGPQSPSLEKEWGEVFGYRPPRGLWWRRYGIPGYLRFRAVGWSGWTHLDAEVGSMADRLHLWEQAKTPLELLVARNAMLATIRDLLETGNGLNFASLSIFFYADAFVRPCKEDSPNDGRAYRRRLKTAVYKLTKANSKWRRLSSWLGGSE